MAALAAATTLTGERNHRVVAVLAFRFIVALFGPSPYGRWTHLRSGQRNPASRRRGGVLGWLRTRRWVRSLKDDPFHRSIGHGGCDQNGNAILLSPQEQAPNQRRTPGGRPCPVAALLAPLFTASAKHERPTPESGSKAILARSPTKKDGQAQKRLRRYLPLRHL